MRDDRLQAMTVNAIIARYPETVSVFADFGIDACCGGARTVRDVASRHHMDLGALITAIRLAADRGVTAPALDDAEPR